MDIRNGKEAQRLKQEISDKYDEGKLKPATMKKFLKNYYDGNPEEFSGRKDDLLSEYLAVQLAMIGDDGNVHPFEEPYYRDGKLHCCGREMKDLQGMKFCTVCGREEEEI